MSAPRLAPAPETFRAEDIALVRPYYTAHEHERGLSRIQAEATTRLRAWSHRSAPAPVPSGDLLAAAR